MLCKLKQEGRTEDLDKTLCTRVSHRMDIQELIEEINVVMKSARNESFRTQRASKKAMSNTSVRWWTEELTIMRKRGNALRRRYQRMRNSEEVREQRKTQYLEGNARYVATVKKRKKQFREGVLQHDVIY